MSTKEQSNIIMLVFFFLSYYGLNYTCKTGKSERLEAIKRHIRDLFPKI